ncbi:hypothetical protein AS850_03790 [Frondihabitans sp. 762G35]|nr:hypothetical protein AS850_03790 [Frondihabitans sp. 762G35]
MLLRRATARLHVWRVLAKVSGVLWSLGSGRRDTPARTNAPGTGPGALAHSPQWVEGSVSISERSSDQSVWNTLSLSIRL